MKVILYLTALLNIYIGAEAVQPRMICYYDTTAATRLGDAQFTAEDMEVALKYCTHVVYGYAGITPNTFSVIPLNAQQEQQFVQMQRFKQKHPQVKFLLSLGGDRDTKNSWKYLELLDAGYQKQQVFLLTTLNMLQKYKFDGLDLAYQLPRTKPKKFHSKYGLTWKSVKKVFTGNFVVDPRAKERRDLFTTLVALLKTSFKMHDYVLTLTVLPNINSDCYFDAPAIIKNLDFVTLATFDFYTPARNPEEADYAAPLHSPPVMGNRILQANVDTQVNLWLAQKVPRDKLNIGVATWGRAWKLTADSENANVPVVIHTDGPAPAGITTKTPGLLSWPEVCARFRQHPQRGGGAPLRRVVDRTKKYGNYAFSIADKYGNNGMWVSYEEPETASYKAAAVRNRKLGGVALFDMGLDDLRGVCTGEKFPILRALKYELL